MAAQFPVLGYLDRNPETKQISGPVNITTRVALGLPKSAALVIAKRNKHTESSPDHDLCLQLSPMDEPAPIAVLWAKQGDSNTVMSGKFAPEFSAPRGLPLAANVIVIRANERDEHGHGYAVKYVLDAESQGGNGGSATRSEFDDDSGPDPFAE